MTRDPVSTREAMERSLDLLRRSATPHGFVASPAFEHYAAVWGRDALITSLGACATTEPDLHRATAASIDTLTAHASPLGQLPAVVVAERDEWDFGEGGTVDTTAWLPIAVEAYLTATGDLERVIGWWPAVTAAIRWLGHLDVTGTGLLSVAPSTDWMDAALTRSGRTLHINALYAWSLAAAERIGAALGLEAPGDRRRVAEAVDGWFWPDPTVDFDALFDHGFAHTSIRREYERLAVLPRRHYVSHIVHAAFVDRCDVLANVIAVIAGVAPPARSETIIECLTEAADPWPSRTFLRPVLPGDPAGMLITQADRAIDRRWSATPGRYHNGAAWPFVGGLHAGAVAATSGRVAARPLLQAVARALAVDGWAFPEWIDADGVAHGAQQQTWNAGAYVWAYLRTEPRA